MLFRLYFLFTRESAITQSISNIRLAAFRAVWPEGSATAAAAVRVSYRAWRLSQNGGLVG